MATITRNEIIDPKTLTAAKLGELVDLLYPVHCEIFAGVSKEEFARYVISSPAEQTRVQISYGEAGDLAGYIAVHAFHRTKRGESFTVTRAEAGLRRPYRGNGSPAAFWVSQILKTRWDYPGRQYYLGCLVHPSSYCAFARDAAALWPAPGVQTPDDMLELMLQLGDDFHLPIVDPKRPLVRNVGWITRDTEVEQRYWQTTDLPAPRFYLEQNPGYGSGHGLLTLVPLDAASLAKGVMNWGSARLKKGLKRSVGALERTVLRPRLDDVAAEDLLIEVEQQTGLDLDAIRQLGVIGTRFPIDARSVLFRAGEQADAMYIILSGSLFVLDDSNPDEVVVIDQLGPSHLVGELALMTGQPRNATVRAAVDSVLLRLSARDITALLDAEPRLAAELWKRIGQRVFERQLRSLPTLFPLSYAARESWYAAATSYSLRNGEEQTLSSATVVVLALGELAITSSQGWMAVSAPALVRLPPGACLTARTAVRIAVLPAEPPADKNP